MRLGSHETILNQVSAIAWMFLGSKPSRQKGRILRTPREVRNALCYVLHNWRRHGIFAAGADPCLSGRWFDGWREAKPGGLGSAVVVRARTAAGG